MKLKLSFLALTLTLLSVNAYALPAFKVADGQYSGEYNGVDLNTAQTVFNNLSPKGAGGGAPVGTIVAVPSHAEAKFIEEDPDAWVLCDGREVPSGTALRSYMTHTPNLNGEKRFLQGTTGTSGTIAAGLPNITGTHNGALLMWGNPRATGAFTGSNYFSGWGHGNVMIYRGHLVFNAHNANSIYNDDVHTVQPEAYTVRYYIRCNE